ncbi:MAG TPA: FkbM family methyltransferase [Vicinamibacterales bacterium]|jgi:FkbM family methyltransferase|nr:FkbM family methyltransferase [Vicinamibacterales bacterium]
MDRNSVGKPPSVADSDARNPKKVARSATVRPDGVFESNTYYLEKFRGSSGVLVEPVPEMFRGIAINRPTAKAFHCTLVAADHPDSTVSIAADHAVSRIVPGRSASGINTVQVPARTLTSVLAEAGATTIDFLSLDVEGFELKVLSGLDFSRYHPRYMLIECLDHNSRAAVDALLAGLYRRVEEVTYRDALYASLPQA